MPALTHGRVRNGFNGHATNTRRCIHIHASNSECGGVCCSGSSLQPLKANGGTKPKRNFEAKYNAQVNRPHALPSTIGVSTPTQRANALRAFNGSTGPNCKECLPKQTFSKPVNSDTQRK